MRTSLAIPTHDVDPNEGIDGICATDPSSAQLRLWHGQAQLDKGEISSKELALLERLAGVVAGKSRTIFNPYTGEVRKQFLPDWIGKHNPEDPTLVGWRKPQTNILSELKSETP